MTRGVSSAVLDAIATQKIRVDHLLKIETDPDILLTTHYKNLQWNGETYIANGDLLSVPTVLEDLKIRSNNLDFELTGVNQSYIAQFLTDAPTNAPLSLHLAFIDDEGAIIDDPIELFLGLVDNFELKEDISGKKSVLTLTAASVWIDFERIAGRKTNTASQNIFFPGDLGFQFASQIVKDLSWGRSG